MVKSLFLRSMRAAGLMPLVDRLWFGYNRLRFRGRNARFRAAHPGIALPPDYMLYESYRMDQELYFTDGQATARWVIDQLSAYAPLEGARLLDWGCGPARVLRHLPALLPGARFAGSDYNGATIDWCRAHIPGIDFRRNGVLPPLAFEDTSFDAAYALSVLTHLSEEAHAAWLTELHRILRPGGLLLLTTHGAAFEQKLTAGERALFQKGSIVVHAVEKEGHRSYAAFQPKAFMETLFSRNWQVLNFAAGKIHDWGPEQDT
ncbi:MAG: class I SAM-dependent methyltransferase, partial [Chitinophagaceae bacterium]